MEPRVSVRLIALIESAAHSVVVENEEMDSTAIEDALEADAHRGVSVTVVMISDSEWDSAFSQLQSAGVHVELYPDTSSALYIHAKVIDVDSAKVFLGSENLSTASLDYNRELRSNHLIDRCCRTREHHSVQRYLGRSGTEGEPPYACYCYHISSGATDHRWIRRLLPDR